MSRLRILFFLFSLCLSPWLHRDILPEHRYVYTSGRMSATTCGQKHVQCFVVLPARSSAALLHRIILLEQKCVCTHHQQHPTMQSCMVICTHNIIIPFYCKEKAAVTSSFQSLPSNSGSVPIVCVCVCVCVPS